MRARRIVLGSLMVGVAVLAVAVTSAADRGALASSSPHGVRLRLPGATERLVVGDPPSFAYVAQPGAGTRVELRSPTTGRVVKVLATFGPEFTNNGLALSNDGREVYVTLIGRRNLRIEQIAASTGKRTFIANGWEPAVSPNGRLLSYIEGRASVVVRNLSSGVAHRISVAGRLGRSEVLDGSDPATWLGDGSEVVVMVTPMAVAVASQAGPAQAANQPSASLIVVHVGAGGRPLRADRVELSGASDLFRISGDQTHPRSLLVASLGPRTLLDRVDLGGSRPEITQLVSLPQVLPLAFDPAAHYVLYVAGHPKPALWIAEIGRGKLTGARRLVPNAQLGEVSW
jgi:hypothetical protein